MKKVAVIDYGMCNLDSVARAVEKCCGDPVVTDNPVLVESADAIILPGVGSFNDAMQELSRRELIPVLQNKVREEKVPFMGICLGMHLMATTGSEGGRVEGLSLIEGEVVRLTPDQPQTRIPHIGWNEVRPTATSSIFAGVAADTDFYFVHSYQFVCAEKYVLARTPYCGGFISAVGIDGCFGVQFHPEKSLKAGMKILSNFIGLC